MWTRKLGFRCALEAPKPAFEGYPKPETFGSVPLDNPCKGCGEVHPRYSLDAVFLVHSNEILERWRLFVDTGGVEVLLQIFHLAEGEVQWLQTTKEDLKNVDRRRVGSCRSKFYDYFAVRETNAKQ